MKILVVGDYIEDHYVFGHATRICPEAAVPVVVPDEEKMTPGGAGLVTAQLKELMTPGDVHAWYGSLSRKKRIFAGHQLVCRLDQDSVKYQAPPFPTRMLELCDAVVVSDYGKGAITKDRARDIVETGSDCYVDAKNHWHWYEGSNVVIFPNERECLDETFMADQVVRKLGENGAEYFNVRVPATVREVVDVTGAGDVFLAAFVYATSEGLKAVDCLRFANALAGESCRHRGTYVVPKAFAKEVLDSLRASKESPRLFPGPDGYSIGPGPRQYLWTSTASALCGSPHEDLLRDATGQAVILDTLDSWQTPRILPSDRTDTSDIQPLADRVEGRAADELPKEHTGPNPNATVHPHGHRSKPDQEKIPG